MRVHQASLITLIICGCFGEPDTVDKIVGTTVPMTTSAEESSSSSDGESSSGEDSSTSEAFDPSECPEWCNNGCDLAGGIWAECRCVLDHECPDELSCEGFKPEPYTLGHCR